METHLDFPYKPKAATMALASFFFAGCAAILMHAAQTNDRGLILMHAIHLETPDATTFYWVLAGLSAVFVILGVLALLENLLSTEPPVLKLTPDELIIPPYLFRREPRHVLWRDVTRVTFQKVNGQEFMTLRYGERQKAQITRSWLPKTAWNEVVTFVMAKTSAVGAG